ncbi:MULTISPECIES: AfsR/SARP family transcriptional regulator [unclassified Nonomuraea]|uniref:AfsR/SARP family transcriptional regulator n=1 Tax=unclassified Nonomuraea TaxID=2593643 RepID=UPI0035BF72AE
MATYVRSFRVLGAVTVTVEGVEASLPSQQAMVLAVLLLNANKVVPVDHLAHVLWSDSLPGSHRSRIRMLVSKLRAACHAGPDELIVTRHSGYLLHLRPDQLDSDLFADLVRQARAAATDDRREEAVALYGKALSLWSAPPFPGIDHPSAEAAKARLEELHIAAIEERAEELLALGRAAEVAGDLSEVVVNNPLRERTHGQLMRALSATDRTAEAVELYHQLRLRLREELGLEPAAPLRELYDRLIKGKRQAGPRHLPPATGRLIGRHAELGRITAACQGPVRTVTVVGPAGVGKTSLALRWAHEHAADFPDGQLFLDLRGFQRNPKTTDPLTRLLCALGHAPRDVPEDLDARLSLYRSSLAGRRMLIVLDDAVDAAQVRPLLPGEPHCLTLVTSRDRLSGLIARDGAERITLDVLSLEDCLALLASSTGERRTAAEPEAAAQLVRLCGRLPLALRIAGVLLSDHPNWTIDDFVTRLADHGRLAGLRIEGDDGVAVRQALEQSYAVLAPPARRMFRLINLIPGEGITVGAAAALADVGKDEAEDLLSELARVHLATETGVGRFACHDLLAELAGEFNAAGDPAEREAAADRLMNYYLHSIAAVAGLAYNRPVDLLTEPSAVAPEVFASREEAEAWITAEWESVMAAAEHAARHGLAGMAWRLAHALRIVLYRRRWMLPWLHLARLGLEAARRDGSLVGQAAMHLSLGLAHYCTGDYLLSAKDLEKAAALCRRAQWLSGEADALRALGSALAMPGRHRAAVGRTRQALKIYESIGDRDRAASSINNLAYMLRHLGRLGTAEEYLERARTMMAETESAELHILTLAGLGLVRQEQGRLGEAMSVLSHALRLARAAKVRYGQVAVLDSVAAVYSDAGRDEDALAARQQMLDLAVSIGDHGYEILALIGLARAEIRLERPVTFQLHVASREAESIGHRQGCVEAALGSSELAMREGRLEEARAYAGSALEWATAGYSPGIGKAEVALAVADLGLAELERCTKHCERALRAFGRTGQRLGYARALDVLGQARERSGDERGARSARRRAQVVMNGISLL